MAPSRGSPHSLNRKTQKRGQRQPHKGPQGSGDGSIRDPNSLQQRVVDVFVRAFPHILTHPYIERTLRPALQEIKGHLYNRDFDKAFGRREYLEAYASRWSASRALGYLEIFDDVLSEVLDRRKQTLYAKHISVESGFSTSQEIRLSITCLGGGAGAELCAIAALPHLSTPSEDVSIDVSFVDIADWASVLESLYDAAIHPSSNPIQEADTASSGPLIAGTQISSKFHCMDLLSPSEENRNKLCSQFRTSDLVTLMFTLNELYSTSMPKTQSLLFDLTTNMRPGTLLLVVDSGGSYSTVTINQKEKRYPMQWLLDHTLVNLAPTAMEQGAEDTQAGASDKDRNAEDSAPNQSSSDKPMAAQTALRKPPPTVWERIKSTDSQWFRLPELRYPLELENMRYQLHLYRRA